MFPPMEMELEVMEVTRRLAACLKNALCYIIIIQCLSKTTLFLSIAFRFSSIFSSATVMIYRLSSVSNESVLLL